MKQYHVQLEPGDIGSYVLLPGDPARAAVIAERFDHPRHVAMNREFSTFTGTLDGVAVSVCSTGVGAASTAIAVEELHAIGATTFIRIGTCGGLVPQLHRSDLVVMHAAVRAEGTSQQYVPLPFPAVADLVVTTLLERACQQLGLRYLVGPTVSVDSLYSEISPDTVPIAAEMREEYAAWQASGAVAAEMECGALFTIAAVRRARAGALCVIVDESGAGEMPEEASVPLDVLLDAGIRGVRELIAYDAGNSDRSLNNMVTDSTHRIAL